MARPGPKTAEKLINDMTAAFQGDRPEGLGNVLTNFVIWLKGGHSPAAQLALLEKAGQEINQQLRRLYDEEQSWLAKDFMVALFEHRFFTTQIRQDKSPPLLLAFDTTLVTAILRDLPRTNPAPQLPSLPAYIKAQRTDIKISALALANAAMALPDPRFQKAVVTGLAGLSSQTLLEDIRLKAVDTNQIQLIPLINEARQKLKPAKPG